MDRISPHRLSKKGPLLVFAHANGYPPESYRCFLEPFLSDYQVWQVYLRPFWPGSNPQEIQDWRVFRDDLISDIQELTEQSNSKQPVIGVGHSLGAAALLMSSIQDQELFSQLVLMDPVIFPRWWGGFMRLLAPSGLIKRFHPLIQGTLKRKTWFESREAMFKNYRGKAVFKGLSDQVLMDYVEGLGKELISGGIGLRYSPAWEARIYETGGLADWLIWKNRECVFPPTMIIRGEDTYTLHDHVITPLVSKMVQGEFTTIQGTGHLLPLEDPLETATAALEFLSRAYS